jgi:hypothetical protein
MKHTGILVLYDSNESPCHTVAVTVIQLINNNIYACEKNHAWIETDAEAKESG